MSTHLSNSESTEPVGRRSRRARSEPERQGRRSRAGSGRRDADDRDDAVPEHDDAVPEPDGAGGRTRRGAQSGRVGRSARAARKKKSRQGRAAAAKGARSGRRSAEEPAPQAGGARRSRRSASADGRLDPVSRFSASALRRVTVLGDRPGQVVYSLAEQSRRKRGTYILGTLFGLFGVALVALLGMLAYQFFSPADVDRNHVTQIVAPPEGHTTLQPDLYHAQEQQEIFDPIVQRPEDGEPLTEEEVFDSAEKLKLDDFELTLRESEVTDACTGVVWGDEIAQTLADGSCASAARGVYRDADETYVAQFTLFDLADADASAAASEALGPGTAPGFVLPLNTEIDGLQKGYSQATSQVMGHYLAVFWVARTDGGEPEDDDSMATLNVVAMDAAVSVYEKVRDTASDDEG
ncbi:hypothetical protein HDA32_003657 [Spinactinospora alkalitolerans]|uniref:Uncharacterized protein n=1 Tax=Spinactinospora alkalitolerans TaxID=687207 RepID=A0A852TZ04_9ACTN|nr:hypothetical protein [Spinactinospora alkalitolerans]NYE48537.1 hypothetical protein [Spinactinospora alkalitolerans]